MKKYFNTSFTHLLIGPSVSFSYNNIKDKAESKRNLNSISEDTKYFESINS